MRRLAVRPPVTAPGLPRGWPGSLPRHLDLRPGLPRPHDSNTSPPGRTTRRASVSAATHPFQDPAEARPHVEAAVSESTLLREDAGHHPDRVFEPNRIDGATWPSRTLCGYQRIQGKRLKLGYRVSASVIRRVLKARSSIPGAPWSNRWGGWPGRCRAA